MPADLNLDISLALDGRSITDFRKQTESAVSNLKAGIDASSFRQSVRSAQLDVAKNKVKIGIEADPRGLKQSLANAKDLERQLARTGVQVDKFTISTQKASSATLTFAERVGFSATRLASYLIPANAIFRVAQAFSVARDAVVAINKDINRLTQIFQGNAGKASQVAKEILGIAKTFGQSGRELLSITTLLAQSGQQFASTSDLISAASALAQTPLASTFGTIEDTTRGAIAALNQFNLSGEDTVRVLDAANAVSKEFAVQAADIFTAVQTGGSAFKIGGGTIEEFSALVGAARQLTGISARTVGTGFNTIFLRLLRPDSIQFLEQLTGGRIRDAEGNLKRITDILLETGKAFRTLNTEQKAQVSEKLFGIRQGKLGIPLLDDIGRGSGDSVVIDALKVAANGAGSLATDATQGLERIDVILSRIGARFEEVFGDLAQDKNLISFFEQLADVAGFFADTLSTIAPLIPSLLRVGTIALGASAIKGIGGAVGGAGIFAGGRPDQAKAAQVSGNSPLINSNQSLSTSVDALAATIRGETVAEAGNLNGDLSRRITPSASPGKSVRESQAEVVGNIKALEIERDKALLLQRTEVGRAGTQARIGGVGDPRAGLREGLGTEGGGTQGTLGKAEKKLAKALNERTALENQARRRFRSGSAKAIEGLRGPEALSKTQLAEAKKLQKNGLTRAASIKKVSTAEQKLAGQVSQLASSSGSVARQLNLNQIRIKRITSVRDQLSKRLQLAVQGSKVAGKVQAKLNASNAALSRERLRAANLEREGLALGNGGDGGDGGGRGGKGRGKALKDGLINAAPFAAFLLLDQLANSDALQKQKIQTSDQGANSLAQLQASQQENQRRGTISGALGGASQGATIGLIAGGPVGAFIGGVVGALGGAFLGLTQSASEAAAELLSAAATFKVTGDLEKDIASFGEILSGLDPRGGEQTQIGDIAGAAGEAFSLASGFGGFKLNEQLGGAENPFKELTKGVFEFLGAEVETPDLSDFKKTESGKRASQRTVNLGRQLASKVFGDLQLTSQDFDNPAKGATTQLQNALVEAIRANFKKKGLSGKQLEKAVETFIGLGNGLPNLIGPVVQASKNFEVAFKLMDLQLNESVPRLREFAQALSSIQTDQGAIGSAIQNRASIFTGRPTTGFQGAGAQASDELEGILRDGDFSSGTAREGRAREIEGVSRGLLSPEIQNDLVQVGSATSATRAAAETILKAAKQASKDSNQEQPGSAKASKAIEEAFKGAGSGQIIDEVKERLLKATSSTGIAGLSELDIDGIVKKALGPLDTVSKTAKALEAQFALLHKGLKIATDLYDAQRKPIDRFNKTLDLNSKIQLENIKRAQVLGATQDQTLDSLRNLVASGPTSSVISAGRDLTSAKAGLDEAERGRGKGDAAQEQERLAIASLKVREAQDKYNDALKDASLRTRNLQALFGALNKNINESIKAFQKLGKATLDDLFDIRLNLNLADAFGVTAAVGGAQSFTELEKSLRDDPGELKRRADSLSVTRIPPDLFADMTKALRAVGKGGEADVAETLRGFSARGIAGDGPDFDKLVAQILEREKTGDQLGSVQQDQLTALKSLVDIEFRIAKTLEANLAGFKLPLGIRPPEADTGRINAPTIGNKASLIDSFAGTEQGGGDANSITNLFEEMSRNGKLNLEAQAKFGEAVTNLGTVLKNIDATVVTEINGTVRVEGIDNNAEAKTVQSASIAVIRTLQKVMQGNTTPEGKKMFAKLLEAEQNIEGQLSPTTSGEK